MTGEAAAIAVLLVGLVSLGNAGSWILAGPFVAAIPLALFSKGRFTHKLTLIQYVLMGAPFALVARLDLVPIEDSSGLGLTFPYFVALYLSLVALLHLAAPPSPLRLPVILFCAASGLASVGANTIPGRYLALVAAFAIPAIVVLRHSLSFTPHAVPGRGVERLALLVAAFALTAGLAATLTLTLEHYYEDLSAAFVKGMKNVPLQSAGGFSGKARLGNVVQIQGEDQGRGIALRAFSKTAPGYLRAKTFATYQQGEWTASGPSVERRSTLRPEATVRRFALDGRPPPLDEARALLAIKPDARYGAHFFLPLAATAVDTECEILLASPGGTIASRYTPTSSGYDVHIDRAPVLNVPGLDLALPDDPAVLAALDALIPTLGRPGSPEDAVSSVRNHFARHYEYQFGITFEPGSDPIVQFLTKKDRGHCELFATAGTLLLRRMGVRARYVTGFQCLEKNPDTDDLWLARNKHAHAWTEFVGRDGAWQTGELTPASGLPTFEPASGAEALVDWLRGVYEKIATAVSRQGLLVLALGLVRGGLVWLVAAWWRVLLLVLAAAIFVARRFRGRAPRVRALERVFPDDMGRERESFLRLERSLARKGLGKLDAETLPEYASRLAGASFPDREAALELVNRFARRRYAPFVAPPGGPP